MLFNLSSTGHFPSKDGGIRSFHVRGPCFTEGSSNRLSAETSAFGSKRECISWATNKGYVIPLEDGINKLTN